jgi:hypothetical protein
MTLAHAGNHGEATMHRSTAHLVSLAGAAGLMLMVSACAIGSPHQASPAGKRTQHATAVVNAAPQPAAAPAAGRAPATPAPAASPTAAAPAAATSPATGSTGPHFATPQAAMAYLAAAYNSDDTAALHVVTNAQSFTSLQSMRTTDTNLRLTSCRPTGHGDDECTFRYTYVGEGQHAARNAMVTAAPALNPGWYMYRFIEGCD